MEVKSPTTYVQQYDKLISRGCIIEDKDACLKKLSEINYYRLSAYFLPFKNPDDTYFMGTKFETVVRIYNFDAEIRALLFSAVEWVETYLRTRLAHYHAHKYGALGYLDSNNFNDRYNFVDFKKEIDRLIEHNKNSPFVKHHIDNYDRQFPFWVIVELFTPGMLSRFYADMKTTDRKKFSSETFHCHYEHLKSWLVCLSDLRNRCAHYSRLYHWPFAAVPAIRSGVIYKPTRRLFDAILCLKWLMVDQELWKSRYVIALRTLVDNYADSISLFHIGFPQKWETILRA